MNILYRYEIEYTNEDNDHVTLRLNEIQVIKETEKCYFIDVFPHRKLKRVLKNAMNTYAYNTKEKALEHFKRRTQKRVSWYHFWMKQCQVAIKLADRIKPEDRWIEDTDNMIMEELE